VGGSGGRAERAAAGLGSGSDRAAAGACGGPRAAGAAAVPRNGGEAGAVRERSNVRRPTHNGVCGDSSKHRRRLGPACCCPRTHFFYF